MDATLLRLIDSPTEPTYGIIYIGGKPLFTSLEPPNKYNIPELSCIPEGVYTCVKREGVFIGTRSYHYLYEVTGVYKRTGIYFHVGNFKEDTKGCILVGKSFTVQGVYDSEVGFGSFMRSFAYPGNLSDFKKSFILTIRTAR